MKINEILKQTSTKVVGVLIIIILAMGAIIYFQHQKNIKIKDKLETEVNLKNALLDSVHHYQNIRKEWVAEKLTIQESIKNLEKINGQLNDFQKELLARIKESEKKYDVIVAALIKTNVKIDSLLHGGKTVVDTTNKRIDFSDWHKDGKKEVIYAFTIGNVLPADITIKPTLMIDSLYFPNTSYIDFHWKNDKKNGYPVAFSVSNSNAYFKTVNIESYAIPAISKEKLNPNGWQKIENFFIRNTKLGYISVGIIGGVAAYKLLTK